MDLDPDVDCGVSREEISQWTTEALRDFLRKRGLKLGNRGDMIALVIAAVTLDLPILQSEVERRRARARTYRELLHYNGENFPDPISELKDGWIGEQEGMKNWPPTMYRDICLYLLENDTASLQGRIMRDYKEGKAYSYFASSWLKEIFFHPINGDSRYCLVKAKCTPSQNIRGEPHDAWVMCRRDDGTICSAYCTCVAGLGQTCNHVAAMLFKMDHAFKSGLINPSCTSVANSWIATSKGVLPRRVNDVSWERHLYGKGLASKSPKLVKPKSLRFSASEKRTSSDDKRKQLAEVIRSSMPQAVMLGYTSSENYNPDTITHTSPADDLNIAHTVSLETSPHHMPPLTQVASAFTSSADFIAQLPTPTKADINHVEAGTRGQSSSSEWQQQRVGRITASIVNRVYTRTNTMKNKDNVDTSKLLSTVMRTSSIQTKQMKRGVHMEPIAKKAYMDVVLANHTNAHFQECGLLLTEEHASLAASPDMLMECDCHGQGVVEIKCPDISDTPVIGKPGYIQESPEGLPILNPMHTYHHQVIMQMAITKRKFCHFFVYTPQGSLLLNIEYDACLWDKLKKNSIFFWEQVVAPHLYTMTHKSTNATTSHQPSTAAEQTSPSSPRHTSTEQSPPQTTGSKAKKRKAKGKTPACRKRQLIYICNICNSECKQLSTNSAWEDNSICCDNCQKWCHFVCVNILDDDDDQLIEDRWFCPNCKDNNAN